jgi:hypothetical protein
MTNEEMHTLLRKPAPYTEEELSKLCEFASQSIFWGAASSPDVLQVRASVELIRAVQQFDKASGRLVETTNKLTGRGLWLSFGAIIVALASLGVSCVALFKRCIARPPTVQPARPNAQRGVFYCA